MMRFVKSSDREFSSFIHSLPNIQLYAKNIKFTKWNLFKWKSLTLMKDPMTLSIYLQLLQDIRPKTILEFGTYEGGSALWFSDMMISLGSECRVHTFDINEERVNLPSCERLTFHLLDNHKIKEHVQANRIFFESLEHPIVVVEDSHVNVIELISCIDIFLEPDDYLIIEDTLDERKHIEMNDFLVNHKYLIDVHYCDFWGHNNGWNVNSFLKKI